MKQRPRVRPRLRDVLLLLAGGVFVASKGHDTVQRQAAAAVDQAASAAASVASLGPDPAVEVTGASRAGRHLGFDTYAYPGDAAMRAWRHRDVPYEWVGYYLPAPCHKGTTWSGKRERLVEMGWGIAVIYVGQQAWEQMGHAAPKPKAVRKASRTRKASSARKASSTRRASSARKAATTRKVGPSTCARPLLSAARGRVEADDAIARTEAEGFPRGSVIFLDIERMERTPQAMRDYYRAWTARVLADGRYRPGYYAHKHNAQRIYADVKTVYAAAGKKSEPPFWIASGRDFHQDRRPHEVGHHFAGVWQGVLDVVEEWNGVRLPIDVNVASVPSPSSHEYAAAE